MENIDVVDLEEANTTGASDATFNIPLPPGPPPRKTEDHNFTAVIKPDLTREEGELTEDSLNQDQQPLFVAHRRVHGQHREHDRDIVDDRRDDADQDIRRGRAEVAVDEPGHQAQVADETDDSDSFDKFHSCREPG